MKNLLFYIFFLLLNFSLSAQYEYEWERYVGNDRTEFAKDMIRTHDGNFLIVGIKKRESEGLWLIKISPSGKLIWSKKYYEYNYMHPVKLVESKDGGVLIISNVSENWTTDRNIWLLKLDYGGNEIWQRLYEGKGMAWATSGTATADRGFAISAYTSSDEDTLPDLYLLKVDSLGFFQWEQSFGSPYDDRFTDICQLPDSSIVTVGFVSYAKGAYTKAVYYRTDLKGNYMYFLENDSYKWSKAMSVAGLPDTSVAIAIQYIPDTNTSINNIAVLKLDKNFNKVWKTEITENAYCFPMKIINTYDDCFALLYTVKYDGEFNYDVAVAKINPYGKPVWRRIFHRKSNDYAVAVSEAKDKALYMLSTTYNVENGWNYGIARFKSLEFSNLKFINPKQIKLTVPADSLRIEACVKTYKKPKKVLIIINGTVVDSVEKFIKTDDGRCGYYFEYLMALQPGLNNIIFKVVDYKDYIFMRNKKIYFLPAPALRW